MKLRVRIQRQTSRLEVQGEAPTLQELAELIRQTLLPSHGLRFLHRCSSVLILMFEEDLLNSASILSAPTRPSDCP